MRRGDRLDHSRCEPTCADVDQVLAEHPDDGGPRHGMPGRAVLGVRDASSDRVRVSATRLKSLRWPDDSSATHGWDGCAGSQTGVVPSEGEGRSRGQVVLVLVVWVNAVVFLVEVVAPVAGK
jgi:hypothetical protein